MSEEEVVFDFRAGGDYFVWKSGSTVEWNRTVAEQLTAFSSAVEVICLAGLGAASDRLRFFSQLLNRQLTGPEMKNLQKAFDCANDIKGIKYLGSADLITSGQTILFFDLNEGSTYVDGEIHDRQLYAVAFLLASRFLYLHQGKYSPTTLNMLSPISETLNNINASPDVKQSVSQFIWAAMDPDAPGNNEDEMFPTSLLTSYQKSIVASQEQIRENLKDKVCHIGSFVCPIAEKDDQESYRRIYDLIVSTPSVKSIFDEQVNGEMLNILAKTYVDNVNNGLLPDIYDAWDSIVEMKSSAVAKEALKTYVDCLKDYVDETCLNSAVNPIDFEAFENCHQQLWQMVVDMFHSEANFNKTYCSPMRSRVKKKLKQDLDEFYQSQLAKIRNQSRNFCEEKCKSIKTRYFTSLMKSRNNLSFSDLKDCFNKFLTCYHEEAVGPMQDKVLLDFLQYSIVDIFANFEEAAIKNINSSQLERLEAKLKEEYKEKKTELIDHFENEAIKLRSSFAQEEKFKSQTVKLASSRKNIEENELKNIKAELEILKSENQKFEELIITNQLEKQELAKQKTALEDERKKTLAELESEKKARDEMNRILSESLCDFQKKEEKLNHEIHELKQNEADKMQKVIDSNNQNSKLLSKTIEEKEELQKKLGDFFLKVTNLPDSLQQYFFCCENSSDLLFEDALTEYMSES